MGGKGTRKFCTMKEKKTDTESRIVLKMNEPESTCGHSSGGDWRFFFLLFPSSFLCPDLFPLFALALFVSVSSGNSLQPPVVILFIYFSWQWVFFFFFKCNPHPRRLSETSMTSCDSVYGRLLCAPFVGLRSEERAFCVRANAPNGPLLRISVYTRQRILRGWGDVLFFFWPDAAEKSSRTEGCLCDAHTEWLVSGGSLCVCENFSWKIWGASYSQLLTQRERCCARVFPCSCRFSVL